VAGTGGAASGTVNGSSTVNTLGSGFSFPVGVAVDGSGNVFVGDDGHQAVKEIELSEVNFGSVAVATTTPPTLTLQFTFTAAGTIAAPAVLTQGATGKDFTDAGTGTCTTNGTAQAYAAGDSCTIVISFTPMHPGPRYGAVELLNSAGTAVVASANVYGTGTGPQITFSPGMQSTLGSGFNVPSGVAVDGSGNVFVADFGNNAVKEILAVNGSIPATPTIKTLGSGFNGPQGVAVDGSGNVFVADTNNSAVKEILAVNGSIPASPTINTLGSGFNQPLGVTVDGNGNVFVADFLNGAVKEILAVNGSIPTSPTINSLGSGFSLPEAVAVDGSENVFVADTFNSAVKEILAVNGSIPASPTINTLGGGFNGPQGVAVDGSGNVFVADASSSAVKEILAVNGSIPASPTIQTLGSGFSDPNGVAVDGSGNVFVADTTSSTGEEINVSNPPTLAFATADDGTTDGPLSVTITNDGNEPLMAVSPGLNLSTPANFTLVDGSGTLTNCTASFSLAEDASCNLSIEFAPAVGTASGTVNGSVILTDNNLNATTAPGTQQTIPLVGTAEAASTVTGVSPTSGPAAGGTVITITGNNFTEATSVSFGGMAVSFLVNSATSIMATSPAGMGTVDVVVTNPSGSSAMSAADRFTYIPTITLTPLMLPPTVGAAYSQTLSASGGASPYTYSISAGTLPSGITLNSTTGVISGTPAAAGPFSFTITAKDSNGFTATQSYSFIVAMQVSQTIVSASPTMATPVQTVTLTAVVSATVAGTSVVPSGSVTFLDSGTPVGTATLSGGTAQLKVPSLPSGATAVITATYTGDGNFLGGTSSNSASVVVAPFDFTFTTTGMSTSTAAAGAAATYNFALTPLYGSYAGSVSFSVTGLPTGATASITPSTVAVGGGAMPVGIMVQTAAAFARNHDSSNPFGRGIVLALLLLPLIATRRLREQLKGRMLVLVLLTAGLMATLTGCGSQNGSSQESSQTYTLTVTATSGTLQHSQTVTLIVQ
jgi:large repetitive protein